jgi:hypothetical protein
LGSAWLLGFRFGFPQLFPLSSTQVLAGHAGKFRKAAFHKVTHGADAFAHVISKCDKKRCPKLDQPAMVHGDRIHSWDDDSAHCVSLNSAGLDSYDSIAFARGASVLAGLLGVSGIAGGS